MSLLLDALKKAADDKQKVSQSERADEASATEVDAASSPASSGSDSPLSAEIPDDSDAVSTLPSQEDVAVTTTKSDEAEELTLEDIGTEVEGADIGENNQEIPELTLV